MRYRVTSALVAAFLTGFFATAASAQHAQYYVLDAYGGVHAGGGAPAISPPPPYFGFDLAVDVTLVPISGGGDGILVLDKFGGVHNGGALVANPPIGGTPYFGFDVARAIVHRAEPTPPAPTSATIYRAGVSNSTVSPSSVGVAGIRRLAAGKNNVLFANDITSCQRVAGLGKVTGYLPWTDDGPRGEVYSFLAAGPNQGRELIVVTRDGGGNLVDTDFFIIVIC